jgi:hypothetical protein
VGRTRPRANATSSIPLVESTVASLKPHQAPGFQYGHGWGAVEDPDPPASATPSPSDIHRVRLPPARKTFSRSIGSLTGAC